MATNTEVGFLGRSGTEQIVANVKSLATAVSNNATKDDLDAAVTEIKSYIDDVLGDGTTGESIPSVEGELF